MMLRQRWATALAVLAAGLLSAAPAAGDTPVRTGWWTEAQQGAYTGNHQLPLDQTPNASDLHVGNAGCQGPSLPCGGVPNTPAGSTPVKFGSAAISAIAYAFPPGQLSPSIVPGTVIAQLRLPVDGVPVGHGFKLLACRILGPWLAVNGGDWTQRPPYQPGGCSVGVPSADGKTIGFTIVAALAGRNSLELALVPAAGDPTPFDVLLRPADTNAMAWQPAARSRPVRDLTLPPPSARPPLDVPAVTYETGLAAGPGPSSSPVPSAPDVALAPLLGPRRFGGHLVTEVAHRGLILLCLGAIVMLVAFNWSRRLRSLVPSARQPERGVGRFTRARPSVARRL